jgi:cysteine desulfurase
MERFPEGNAVVSAIEHESVLEPSSRYECRQVAVGTSGRLDLDDLRRKIDDKTVLVSVGYANNEIGTVQPIRDIGRIIKEKRAARKSPRPIIFHTDACQAANYLDLHASRLGVDMMTLNGGKIYGPKQSGALYVKAGTVTEPLILGGGQERGLRSGTENVAGAVGFAEALELVQTVRAEEADRLRKLRGHFMESLLSAAPDTIFNQSVKYHLPNNVHATFPGRDNERLLVQLDEAGILAAAGSACSADSGEPSHVLRAIGLSDADARSSLRFTMGRDTTKAMIDKTVHTLAALLSS